MSAINGRRKASLAVVCLVLLAALLSACGGGGDSSSSTAAEETQASGNSAQEQAQKTVAEFSAEQPPIKIPAISGPPPKGKSVALISCPVTVCVSVITGAEEAADALGWSHKTFQSPLTPEGYSATWTNALRSNPDAIIYIGGNFPDETVQKQLEEAKERGIPAIGIANNEIPKEGSVLPAVYDGPPQFSESGRLMGALVAAESGSDAHVVFADPQLPPFEGMKKEFAEEVEKAGGSVEFMQTNIESIGKSLPSQIVGYLQSHPDTNYIALALNDMSPGVPQALEAAGLSEKVKLLSRAPSPSALADIKSGAQFASVAEETSSNGWRAVDAVIRLMLGDSLNCCRYPAGWHQILTKENITDPSATPKTPGDPDAFLEAWGVK